MCPWLHRRPRADRHVPMRSRRALSRAPRPLARARATLASSQPEAWTARASRQPHGRSVAVAGGELLPRVDVASAEWLRRPGRCTAPSSDPPRRPLGNWSRTVVFCRVLVRRGAPGGARRGARARRTISRVRCGGVRRVSSAPVCVGGLGHRNWGRTRAKRKEPSQGSGTTVILAGSNSPQT